MSRHRNETYTCPKCGHTQEFLMWESVNVQLNPEMKEKILDRSFFSQTCDICGTIAQVLYTFLYHDMEARLMVYIVSAKEPDELERHIKEINKFSDMLTNPPNDEIDALVGSIKDEYTLRIVTDYNQLLEKIYIFRNGLDDRLVEMYKLYSFVQKMDQLKDKNVNAIYFDESRGDGHKIVVVLDNGDVGTLDFSMEFYNILHAEKMDIIEANTPKGYCMIDQQWATGIISKRS